jgi:hypothetical protein
MKPKLAFILFVVAVCRSEAALEFSAYTQTARELKFVVNDPEEAQASGWLTIGQSFQGYTLVAFDGQQEVLSVRKGDTTVRLSLKASRVKTQSSNTPELARQLAAARDELAEMRKRYLDGHPSVQRQLKKIADLEYQLAR